MSWWLNHVARKRVFNLKIYSRIATWKDRDIYCDIGHHPALESERTADTDFLALDVLSKIALQHSTIIVPSIKGSKIIWPCFTHIATLGLRICVPLFSFNQELNNFKKMLEIEVMQHQTTGHMDIHMALILLNFILLDSLEFPHRSWKCGVKKPALKVLRNNPCSCFRTSVYPRTARKRGAVHTLDPGQAFPTVTGEFSMCLRVVHQREMGWWWLTFW